MNSPTTSPPLENDQPPARRTGFGILVALRTRNVQATQSGFLLFFPLLFLAPNLVIVALGAVLTALSLRTITNYDR